MTPQRLTLYRLFVLALIIAFWWVLAEFVGGNLVASPLESARAAVALVADGTLPKALGHSLQVYLTGYLLAAAFAIPFGLAMGGLQTFGRTLEIYVNALTATPRVAFIPLIIVFLGLGEEAKIVIIFLGAVMPILINTYAGVLDTDRELLEMARATGAGRLQIFMQIMLPSAMPFIIVGLRLGAAIGLINTVVAELYTAVSGLGGLLSIYGNTFQMDRYFVIVIVLAAIGAIVTQSLKLLEKRVTRWR